MISVALIYYLILPQTVSAHDRIPAGSANDVTSDFCVNGFSNIAKPLNWNRLTPKSGAPVREVVSKTIDEYNPDFLWNDLGQGNIGHVYRVTPPQGPAYVIKQYADAGMREFDQKSLEYIRSIARRIESPTVEIVDSVDVGERSMRLTDIRGRDLEHVYENAWLGEAEKKSLFNRWNQFVRDFRKEVGTAVPVTKGSEPYSESDGVLRWTFSLEEKNGSMVLIRLKPDNVLVESGTGRLIIIDPN